MRITPDVDSRIDRMDRWSALFLPFDLRLTPDQDWVIPASSVYTPGATEVEIYQPGAVAGRPAHAGMVAGQTT